MERRWLEPPPNCFVILFSSLSRTGIISRYETDKTIPSIDVAKKIANALEVSLDYLTELDYSLYIDDQEMTKLLKGYDKLKDEEKLTIKKIIKAFSFYSKIQDTQNGFAL
ncbi:MAG: helix-turn-helix transcriptional regulator [Bacteroidetes bacterium]|nr:helix-turn-helix transcriptional regulator [Bacteroidota bacterium]